MTSEDYLDMLVFILVCYLWEVVFEYESKPMSEELFGPEEDSKSTIKFLVNVIHDINFNIFHLDYLLAAVTFVIWTRYILMLRLSDTFGHVLIMIYEMLKTIILFQIIFFLVLITFSCIATLTLTYMENY